MDFKERLISEYKELNDRLLKLNTALSGKDFKDKVGDKQYNLMQKQADAMSNYSDILFCRMKDLKIEVK